jgi:hypothetical protein
LAVRGMLNFPPQSGGANSWTSRRSCRGLPLVENGVICAMMASEDDDQGFARKVFEGEGLHLTARTSKSRRSVQRMVRR